MNKRPVLATALITLASFPLLAQQSSPATQQPMQQSSPAAQQEPTQSAPATPSQTAEAAAQSSAQTSAPVQLSPVQGELVSKLDTKTAKTGDNVVVQTKSSAKTADGTEIPKGSKLVGHVVAVKASEAGATSQVALQFDHIELAGGQNLAVHSQIQSIAPPGGAADASASTSSPAMSSPAASGSPSPNAAVSSNRPSSATQPAGASTAAAAPNGAPAAGTVVATNGNIAIQTTSIPGVLLANNAPGEQDPRMARTSSILLGAKRDVQLDGGTEMVIGVSAAGGTR
jgi:hypothetical protein